MKLDSVFFRVVTPRSVGDRYQRFEGTCCLLKMAPEPPPPKNHNLNFRLRENYECETFLSTRVYLQCFMQRETEKFSRSYPLSLTHSGSNLNPEGLIISVHHHNARAELFTTMTWSFML